MMLHVCCYMYDAACMLLHACCYMHAAHTCADTPSFASSERNAVAMLRCAGARASASFALAIRAAVRLYSALHRPAWPVVTWMCGIPCCIHGCTANDGVPSCVRHATGMYGACALDGCGMRAACMVHVRYLAPRMACGTQVCGMQVACKWHVSGM